MFFARGLVAVAAALVTLGGPAHGAQAPGGAGAGPPGAGVLDGYVLGRPPPGLGPHVSDFAYEWGGVGFHSRVWESGPDSSGGYRVDFTVAVLRGERLRDPAALRSFMAGYLERPAGSWRERAFTGRPGFTGADDAFFLDRPGVAVYARLERPGADRRDLLEFMEGVRPDVESPGARV